MLIDGFDELEGFFCKGSVEEGSGKDHDGYCTAVGLGDEGVDGLHGNLFYLSFCNFFPNIIIEDVA